MKEKITIEQAIRDLADDYSGRLKIAIDTRTEEMNKNHSVFMSKFMKDGFALYMNTINPIERKNKIRKTREDKGDWTKLENPLPSNKKLNKEE